MEYRLHDDSSEFETVAQVQNRPFQPNINRRKYSYVWRFFRAIKGTKLVECVICQSGNLSRQTSNLSRHLAVAHDITKESEGIESKNRNRGRASRSFIWKYCTKENIKYARCHLCNKLLYFGGGNTGNISKHLRRKHLHTLRTNEDIMDETTHHAMSTIDTIEIDTGDDVDIDGKGNKYNGIVLEVPVRKERKGSSYVWNYCDKLTRTTIRCKLCSKVMSFHGTANVITHLQRKHNILGKLDDNNVPVETTREFTMNDDTRSTQTGKDMKEERRKRRSLGTMSVVWKYCTRVDKETVRCGFCNKNLSYQGTSNLQRHLHRMHGVAANSRCFKTHDPSDNYEVKMLSTDIIWQHCTMIDDENIKCNMCCAVFDAKNMDLIGRHLAVSHTVMPPKRIHPQRTLKRPHSGDDTTDDDDDDDNDNWGSGSKYEDVGEDSSTQNFDESNTKKEEFLYDDIIEEEPEQSTYEEDPFNPQEETVIENPLSPQTSRENTPERKVTENTKRLENLREELVRMETEYYREKAGFYRMQKYLSALQARKVRLEVERMDSATTAYSVDMDNIQQ